jgi:hypothetical protein
MKYFLLLVPVIFLSSPKYGPEYNPERIKRGIPIIEDGWKVAYELYLSPTSYIVYSKDSSAYLKGKEAKKGLCLHNGKMVQIEESAITGEIDYYVYYLSPKKVKHLRIDYSYIDNSWKCYFNESLSIKEQSFSKRCKDTSLGMCKNIITLPQADSVLASWGLSRTGK